jgi:hypothetical protein
MFYGRPPREKSATVQTAQEQKQSLNNKKSSHHKIFEKTNDASDKNRARGNEIYENVFDHKITSRRSMIPVGNKYEIYGLLK